MEKIILKQLGSIENNSLIGWLIILHNGIITPSNLKQYHEGFFMECVWFTNTNYEKIMSIATYLSSCNPVPSDIF